LLFTDYKKAVWWLSNEHKNIKGQSLPITDSSRSQKLTVPCTNTIDFSSAKKAKNEKRHFGIQDDAGTATIKNPRFKITVRITDR
jgi:hypothetical protein